ncbi:MAG TPA: cytochrome P450, partial [Candidatus Binatia bacterium]|nr:cytochrome P450 [Candidatus Binatia bacterium]
RYDDVMAVSRDPETFCSRHSSRPDSPPIPSMINLDDPLHKRRRNLVNRGFTPRRVADHAPRIRAVCVELIERVIDRGTCDFVRDLAAPLPMIVIGDLLGVETEDHDLLLRWSDDMICGLSASAPPELLQRATDAFSEYADYHRRVVADRRTRPRDDLLSLVMHAEIDGQRLSDEEVLQESLLILVGGDETTRHVLSGGMEQLIRHPDLRRTLRSDLAGVPVAVEEMLRWVTPIQNMNRTATRDITLHGERIREGDKLLLLYPSANRDPRRFRDPDVFNPTRTPNDHVAFGFGAHYCLGASLARLELCVFFEEVLSRLPELELATDAPLPRRASNFIVGIETMPVVWQPR